MTPAAKTIYYFSFYLFIMGLSLLVSPNTILKIIDIPVTQEIWVRLVGFLAILLGVYYTISAKNNYLEFIKITVPTRVCAFICFTIFAIITPGHLMLIGVGLVDFIGAIWTFMALKKSK